MEKELLDRIKACKKKRKMTNEELAQKTGIANSTLAKMLANLSDDMKLSNVIALAEALDVSLEYLVYGTDQTGEVLSESEHQLIAHYRKLDSYGKELVGKVMQLEYTRNQESTAVRRTIRVLPGAAPATAEEKENKEQNAFGARRVIPFYSSLRASAGHGQYLAEDFAKVEDISIPDVDRTRDADMAVQIAGNSMEPKYHSGDILLVHQGGDLQIGDLGLFYCDGEAYFKVFDGDRLLSLNTMYDPIPLSKFSQVYCFGKIIGRLKK